MTIRTFYRPDSTMINLLINTMVGGCMGIKNPEGHRFIAVLHDSRTTREFAKLNEHEESVGPTYFRSPKQIEVGVSLSQITFEEFSRLANHRNGKNCSQYFSIVTTIGNLKVTPTQVPELYVGQYGYYWLNKVNYAEAEQVYIDLLSGFDFYYQYSDDISVYRRNNDKLKEIEAKGRALGLSDERMSEIYHQLSN